MSLSTPIPAAAEHAAAPGPEPSSSQLLKMLVGTLTRLIHPSIAPGIIRAAAAEAGIDVKDLLLPPAPARGRQPKAKASDKPAKMPSRGLTPYTLFVSKVMDHLKEDQDYLNRLPDSNGKTMRPMTVAGIIWKQLGDETRETFVKSYQPLCDALKSERVESGGLKTEGLLAKIHAFEATFDPTVKNQLKDILPANMYSVLHSGAVPALPEGAVHEEDESEESEESEDEDEEDPATAAAAAAAAKRLEEEKRLEAEKKAKEEEAKKKKEDRAAKKKEKKQLAAASPQLAAAAAAPAAGTEDKKAKKKHKPKEQGDQPGSAKKIKKDEM